MDSRFFSKKDISTEGEQSREAYFAHLGAPREREAGEYVPYAVSDEAIAVAEAAQARGQRQSPHFRLVKTDTHAEPSNWTYAKWGAVALFVGISTVSFVTESVLLARDKFFGGAQIAQTTTLDEHAGMPLDGEPMGSDDDNALVIEDYAGERQYELAEADLPKIGAQAYLVADVQTGEIIIDHNGDFVTPIASVSKLMTAIVANEKLDMSKIAIVSRDSYNTYGTQGDLRLGEKIRLYDLMYPLLIESSNDGAEVIADTYGHTEFIEEMNKKAAELGMTNTYYEDPSGLSAKNVSTTHDLLKLVRYIIKTAPNLFDMTRVRQYAILKHNWANKNRFLSFESFQGGKNGFINESRQTTASLFEVTMAKGGKRTVVIILLKTNEKENDATKLINHLKKYATYTAVPDAQ